MRLRRTLNALVAAAITGFGASYAIVSSIQPDVEFVPSPEQTAADSLIEMHDCWTGSAPPDMEGKLPGHVVVSTAGGEPEYSEHLVSSALDQVFNGAHNQLTVFAFCR